VPAVNREIKLVNRNQTRNGDLVLFALAAGMISTFAHGYYYGFVNHLEQLPLIFRAMDPAYLANDFTTNATSGYGPRIYYTCLLALLGRAVPLPVLFLLLTVLQNAAVAFVTALVGRRLFKSDAAAFAGVALVMSVNATDLGEAGYLFTPCLLPASLVMPLALMALWQGIENRPVICAAFAAVAAFIHPLVGLEVGVVGLTSAFLSVLLGIAPEDRPASLTRRLIQVLFSGLGLALFACVVWLGQQHAVLSDRQFIDLYARFRVPHHVITSQFKTRDFGSFGLLGAAAGVSWLWWRRSPGTDQRVAWRIVLPTGIVLALFACGYVFVELLPLRTVAALQFFRLTLVPKWLGLMLIGNAAAFAILKCRESRLAAAGCPVLVGALAAFLVWFAPGSFAEGSSLVAIGLTALAVLLLRNVVLRWASALAIAGTMVVLPLAGVPGIARIRPIFTIAQGNDPADRIADFVSSDTPADAIFVVPPLLGRFRLVARRAIVVSFKDFGFSDQELTQWYERMVDCYGEPEGGGFDAAHAMERRYGKITEERLNWLREKYGATYAVLFASTPCRLPVLYADDHYKLVTIPKAVAD
jgi:hypothetical protein